MTPGANPLSGITIVAMEQAVAAPICSRVLADFGARVIKVENPNGGDFARDYDDVVNGPGGLAAHFVWCNRGKESVTLNLKLPAGTDVQSRVPLGSARSTGMPYGPKVLARYDDFSFNQSISAELISTKWNLSRTRLDEYSAQSHERAAAAQDAGAFIEQIVPVFTDGDVVAADEGIRRGTTVDKLAGLESAFSEDGVIHAGNSSQISDGAAALLVTTAENAVNMGLTPMVRYRAGAVTGADPVLMLTGPIPATHKVLHEAGVGIDEVGV